MTSKISDSDLRNELKRFGFHPGPITDGTRNIYIRKLKEFQQSSPSSPNNVHTSNGSSSATATKPSCAPPATSLRPTTPPHSPVETNKVPLADSTSTNSDNSQDVVQCLLLSLDLNHVAMDTVFLFSDGELLGANRAVIATQCPAMVPILYNREELFPVSVVSTTGQCCFFVRGNEYVADLKEKISLSEGIPVARQRLIFNSTELSPSTILGGCGLTPGAVIQLELLPMMEHNFQLMHTTTTRVVNPSLSISHFTLKLGLEKLVPCLHHQIAIPPQTMHIVHLYDIPSVGFSMLVKYLYSRQLTMPRGAGADGVVHLVVCCVLGSYFGLPSLTHLCLMRIRDLLDKNTAALFVGFSEQIGHQPLVQLCMEHLAQYS